MLFQVFPDLTTKEHPSHVYSDSMPLKQCAVEPPAASKSNSEGTQNSEWHHVTVSMALAHGVRHVSYIGLPKAAI